MNSQIPSTIQSPNKEFESSPFTRVILYFKMDHISVEELNSIRNTMRNHLDSIFQTEKNIDRIPIIIELFNFLQQPNCIHFIKSKYLTKNVILGKCDEFSNINMINVPDEMKQELLITCASLKNMLQSVDIVPML
jgi:hypothetical protein